MWGWWLRSKPGAEKPLYLRGLFAGHEARPGLFLSISIANWRNWYATWKCFDLFGLSGFGGLTCGFAGFFQGGIYKLLKILWLWLV
jgi:hypothetical protein